MSEGPVAVSEARERREWRTLAYQARRDGAAPIPATMLASAAGVRPWHEQRGLVFDDDWLVARDDERSTMSRLVRRQLAVAGRCSTEELATGVLRAQPHPELTAPHQLELVRRWGRHQAALQADSGELSVAPGTDRESWATEADRVLAAACDPAGTTRGELLQALVDAGRTPGTAKQQQHYSPLLRPAGRRGYYVLLGTPEPASPV